MFQMAADQSRREGARGVHRCAADRPREHRLERDDGADGDSRPVIPFSLGAGRDAEDDEHEKESEDDLEDEALHRSARIGGQRGASRVPHPVGKKTRSNALAADRADKLARPDVNRRLRDQGKRPATEKAIVTAGLKCAPLTSPKV